MPPDNKLRIANMALSKLGSRRITSFVEEDSVEADTINAVYDDILEEVLSEHPWSFAQKRIALEYAVPDDTSRTINGRIFTPLTITAATVADPVVISATDHGLATGDRIKINGVTGTTQLNNNFYRIKLLTVDTFSLMDEDTEVDIDGTAFTAYGSGGKVYLANDRTPLNITAATVANPVQLTIANHGLEDGDWLFIQGVAGMTELNGNFYIIDDATTNTFTLDDTDDTDVDGTLYTAYTHGGEILEAPEFTTTDDGTSVVYKKPIDYVKVIKKNDSYALLHVEQDKLISNVENLKIKYTFLNTDTTMYFPKFVNALVARLAAEVAFPLINSVAKSKELMEFYYDVVLPIAISVDSTQGTPDEGQQDEWLIAHSMGSRQFATTGDTWHPSGF